MPIAKLFMSGRNQAVRIPLEYRFNCDEVVIRRDPDTGDVIIRPYNRKFAEWVKLRDELIAEDPEAFASFEIPREPSPDELVRERLAQLGITEADIEAARRHVRASKRRASGNLKPESGGGAQSDKCRSLTPASTLD